MASVSYTHLDVYKRQGATRAGVSDDIVAALEDAMTLGCDVANLSLGSTAGFTSSDTELDLLYERIASQDIVVAIAAGNDGTSSANNLWGTNKNPTAHPDNAVIGSPAIYPNATAVASANNANGMSPYFTYGETKVAYTESRGLKVTFDSVSYTHLDVYKRQVGDYAFQYCVFVQPDLGDALVNLGAYAFAWCPNLEIVIFPDSLVTVGKSAFSNSPKIRSITIGASLTDLGEISFTGANNLETIHVSEKNPVFSSVDGCLLYTSRCV